MGLNKLCERPGIVVHVSNPSILQAEVSRWVQGQCGPHNKILSPGQEIVGID